MTHKKSKLILSLVMVFIIASCSQNRDSLTHTAITSEEIIFVNNPAQMDKKTNVYNSIARAVKYNTDENVRIFRSKIDNFNLDLNKNSSFYDVSEHLNSAIIFTSLNLIENQQLKSNYTYKKIAEGLSLNAIKAHKNALFAEKKIREVERLEKAEQRKINEINKKQNKRTIINDNDEKYKKGIEAALLNLNNLKQSLTTQKNEYAKLVKAGEDDFSLEGRKFYELESLDEKFKIDNFQKTALKKRFEYNFFDKVGYFSSYEQIKNNVTTKYPEKERLLINGYNLYAPIYKDKLINIAIDLTNNLISATKDYRVAKNEEKKNLLKKELINILNVAMFIQIEMDFYIINQTELEYNENIKKIAEVKKEIKNLNKIYRINNENKINLLNKKIELLELENNSNLLMAERTSALRALYFNIGLSPFEHNILKNDIKTIAQDLKIAFNNNMAEMLAQESLINVNEKKINNDWARGDNWLDNLFSSQSTKINSDLSNSKIYDDEKFDKKKNLQLGSYREKDNIDKDWLMMQNMFPELKKHQPIIEKSNINGVEYYRLFVHSPNGGWRNLCNRIINSHMDCLLR